MTEVAAQASTGPGFKPTLPKMMLGAAIASTYVLMVLGNIVTTSGSGLACPDWPLCYGSFNPPKELAVWIEWTHRLLGGVAGILIIASAVYIIRKGDTALHFFMKAALALVLVAATLGGVVVLTEAPLLDTALRITIVSSHIIIATVIFTSLIVAYRATDASEESGARGSYPVFIFGLIYAQIVLGVVVRYSESTLGCPDWPLCHGGIVPPVFTTQIFLHYIHRLMAYTILGVTLWRFVTGFKSGAPGGNGLTLLLVLCQATFGILIVLDDMYLPYVVLHGAIGFALLGWTAYHAAPSIASGRKAVA